ncbi:MAG: polyphosphate kinase 2, partial [Pseudomonadota bacterium]
MDDKASDSDQREWIERELEDSLDEELEMELDDDRIYGDFPKVAFKKPEPSLPRREYFSELLRLQAELVELQDWVVNTNYKLVVVFEGRDA